MAESASVRSAALGPVVRATALSKRYKGAVAVRGVDLDVSPGEIYGVIGPDGAGKSTLLKCVAGVLSFEAGRLELFGLPIESDAAAERVKDRIGFLPQGLGLNLYPELSVEENIDFFARLRLVADAELAERKRRLLTLTRLDPYRDRLMKHLSGGMKQKLGLVCTLVHEPRLVILDEPTTGVDPVSRRDFWSILGQLVDEHGISALISTAYMEEASRFHRVSLLSQGTVVVAGEPREISCGLAATVVSLRASRQWEALERLRTADPGAEPLGPWIRTLVREPDPESAEARVRDLLRGIEVQELQCEEPALEDVFVSRLRPAAAERTSPRSRLARGASPATARGDELAIDAHELTRDFGSFRAVDRVSFRVPQGEIFGLLGANGAGKTTVIKMLTGILRPSAGAGRVAGADMRAAPGQIKERIGYTSQAFSLYPDLSVGENVRLYAGIYGLRGAEARARIRWVIELGGLGGKEAELPGSLPMGLRQRLALGCALVHRPQVLFLDEPTSGVDPLGRRALWELLFRLSREEGVTILVTTHHMAEAERCDHLALMHAGRIVADASPDAMKEQVERESGGVLEILCDRPMAALDALRRARLGEASVFGTRVHFFSRDPERDATRARSVLAAAGLSVSSVARRPLGMEDVFLHHASRLESDAPEAAVSAA